MTARTSLPNRCSFLADTSPSRFFNATVGVRYARDAEPGAAHRPRAHPSSQLPSRRMTVASGRISRLALRQLEVLNS